ncbi:50S ribosomal protein L32 [Candidatus Parcubacteria bacterium]|nr:MAG: 50S ribosomal protein L32 [Candidatus Parcubacteria bacterium]
MGTPTKKRTKSQARKRASHFALEKPALVKCSNCGVSVQPHKACSKCGYYKGSKKVK